MNTPKLLNENLPTGGRRWIDMKDSPLSRVATYEAIRLGWFDSVVVTFPGSRRKRRFLDALSINRYFESLMEEQKQTRSTVVS
jgi:hypothetical protein